MICFLFKSSYDTDEQHMYLEDFYLLLEIQIFQTWVLDDYQVPGSTQF
jgi:hypothetical protein